MHIGSYWNGFSVEQHSIFPTEEEAAKTLSTLDDDDDDDEYSVVEKYKLGTGFVIAVYEKEGKHFVGFL